MSEENELNNNESEAQDALTESALEQVAGGHVVDKASPVLMQVCATGTHIKEATIS